MMKCYMMGPHRIGNLAAPRGKESGKFSLLPHVVALDHMPRLMQLSTCSEGLSRPLYWKHPSLQGHGCDGVKTPVRSAGPDAQHWPQPHGSHCHSCW